MKAMGRWGGGVVPLPWIECCSLFHAACEMCQTDEMNPTAATAGHVPREGGEGNEKQGTEPLRWGVVSKSNLGVEIR